jgi:UDP-N-acetyl-D-mannosaminuronic acid dehydrogenase
VKEFMSNQRPIYEVCVLGGAGHIGLPLSILFAKKGLNTLVYDTNDKVVDIIKTGTMPFMENGAEPLLKAVLAAGKLHFSRDPRDLGGVPFIVITIGTPVDEFLNPSTRLIAECIDTLYPVLTEDQCLILRSTVSPGVTEWLDHYIRSKGKTINVAFCPERVVQGNAIVEIQTLPQIVSGQTPEAEQRAAELFGLLAPELVRMRPIEAEFAKLFCNAYRYIQFAATNQFYMLATMVGADYSKILHGITKDYDRMRDFPRPGFAAGPCLFKDTMQLTSYSKNQFSIGMDAMLVNEGLPLFLVEQLGRRFDLSKLTIGLLGMAFKANSDDSRASLSYKLKKALKLRAKSVLTTDPHVATDPQLLPADEVVSRSSLLILCVPHQAYRRLDLHGKPVVDIWNFYGKDTSLPETLE